DGLSKVLYYTLDGEFIREQKVGYRFLRFAFINNTQIAVDLIKTYNEHLQEISNNQLVLSDTAWRILAKGGDYNAEKERELFFSGEVFSRTEDKLFYLRPFTYTVYQVDKEKLLPYCRLDFGKRTLPEDVNFSYTNPRKFAEKYDDYCFLVDNGHFLKDVFYFKYFYFSGGMKVGHLFRSNTTGKVYQGGISNDMDALGFFDVSASIFKENV
ncbi:6-bladed beta-propeller, partial [Lunatimonas lonarensis]|uniref:6-bladed beta-propeller n=1 Tax=Lunatimonas lonarensis TaxID=1232681 RepID=UPI000564202F